KSNRLKCPTPSVTASRLKPVLLLVTSTVAPGIAAPDESLTSPTIDPYSTCAPAREGAVQINTTTARTTNASNTHRRDAEDIATPPGQAGAMLRPVSNRVNRYYLLSLAIPVSLVSAIPRAVLVRDRCVTRGAPGSSRQASRWRRGPRRRPRWSLG